MMVLATNKQNSSNAIEFYTKNLTPPSNNWQNFSQIVHLNDSKKMNSNKHPKMPPTITKDPPMVTWSDCHKSARFNTARSGSELIMPPKLWCTSESNVFSTSTSVKIYSPTKSPVKKTKQKCSNATPLHDEQVCQGCWICGKATHPGKRIRQCMVFWQNKDILKALHYIFWQE
jgi:hypothetical protein